MRATAACGLLSVRMSGRARLAGRGGDRWERGSCRRELRRDGAVPLRSRDEELPGRAHGRSGRGRLAGLAGGRGDDRRRAHPRRGHRCRLRGDPRLRRALDAARRLRLPRVRGAAVYYDDNEWIAQDLLDWNEVHPTAAAVKAATAIFGAVVRAWDGDATTPCAGGVYWTTAADVRDRNTVSTANGARRRAAPVRDDEATGVPLLVAAHARLDERVHARAQRSLLGPRRGERRRRPARMELQPGKPDRRVPPPVRDDGRRDGARARRAPRRLHARAFSGRWLSEPPEFAAIFFRHLLELAAVDGRPDYVAAAEGYAEDAWNGLRDPQTGLFGSASTATLLGQAAFVQLYAHLAVTDSGAATSGSPPPAAGPTGRGSAGAHADPGRGLPAPRTQPARAGRSGRSSRTIR